MRWGRNGKRQEDGGKVGGNLDKEEGKEIGKETEKGRDIQRLSERGEDEWGGKGQKGNCFDVLNVGLCRIFFFFTR